MTHGTLIVNGVTPSRMQRDIARRLRLVFGKSGITPAEIADEMGVPTSRISNWLNGRALLGPVHAARLAAILDCAPGWLMFGEDARPAAPWDRKHGFAERRAAWVDDFLRHEAERSRVERPAALAEPQRAALSSKHHREGARR